MLQIGYVRSGHSALEGGAQSSVHHRAGKGAVGFYFMYLTTTNYPPGTYLLSGLALVVIVLLLGGAMGTEIISPQNLPSPHSFTNKPPSILSRHLLRLICYILTRSCLESSQQPNSSKRRGYQLYYTSPAHEVCRNGIPFNPGIECHHLHDVFSFPVRILEAECLLAFSVHLSVQLESEETDFFRVLGCTFAYKYRHDLKGGFLSGNRTQTGQKSPMCPSLRLALTLRTPPDASSRRLGPPR